LAVETLEAERAKFQLQSEAWLHSVSLLVDGKAVSIHTMSALLFNGIDYAIQRIAASLTDITAECEVIAHMV
jgi:hypothetical protein